MNRADYLTSDSLPTTEENQVAYTHIQGSDNTVSFANAVNSRLGDVNIIVGGGGGGGGVTSTVSGTYFGAGAYGSAGTQVSGTMSTGETPPRPTRTLTHLLGTRIYDAVIQDITINEQSDSLTIILLRPETREYISMALTRMEVLGYHGSIAEVISTKYRMMTDARVNQARNEAMAQYNHYNNISSREFTRPNPPPTQLVPSGRLVNTKEVETTTFNNTAPLTKEESARLQKLRKAETVVKDNLRKAQAITKAIAKECWDQFIGWLKK